MGARYFRSVRHHASLPCSHGAVPRCYHLPQLREPRGFPPSHLFLFVKGVSGSQFSHNFSPELHAGPHPKRFPTHSFSHPGAGPPVSPAPIRKSPESTFQESAAGDRHSCLPDSLPGGLWMTGGGGTETETEGKIKLPSAPYLSIDSSYAGGNFQAKRAKGRAINT